MALPASLPVGTHSLTIHYAGDATFGSANGAVTATVKAPTPAAAATTTTASADPKKVEKGKSFKAVVAVTSGGGTPAGTVEIYKGSKLLGTGTLGADGKVTIKISKEKAKKLKKGKNTLTAKYLGSTTFLASQATFVVKVKSSSIALSL